MYFETFSGVQEEKKYKNEQEVTEKLKKGSKNQYETKQYDPNKYFISNVYDYYTFYVLLILIFIFVLLYYLACPDSIGGYGLDYFAIKAS